MHVSVVALLIAQVAAILITSRLFGVVFRRLGQPLVVAEIVAGIALGPSLLGVLWPEGMAGLFPAASLGVLSGVSQLGLVLFMFLVGLEFDTGLLRERARLALIIGPYSIVLPFVAGVAMALYLYPIFSTSNVPFTGFALFCGASLAVTAFPVLARILAETGLAKTPLGALTLTCAAFNDVVAWCLLAFVIAVVRAGGVAGAWLTTGATVGFIAVMMLVVRPFLARVASRYGRTKQLSQNALAVVLLLLLGSALLSELIGVHALFGAFLFGAIVPRQGNLVRSLEHRLQDLVLVLLLPLFFASTGLKTEIGLVDTPELWELGAVVVTVASLGKLLGSGIPAWIGGMSLRESVAIGVMMNTRGLMELIILNIGLELGVLSPALFTILVMTAVLSTLITTPVLMLLYPSRLQVERATPGDTGQDRPAREGLPRPVLPILACVSHAAAAAAMARLTAAFSAGTDTRAYALRLQAMQEDATLFQTGNQTEEEDAAQLCARLGAALGVTLQPISFASAMPARDICEVARLKRAEVVLMGAHQSILGRGPLSGPIQEVAGALDADVCMLLDPQEGRGPLLRLLVVPGEEQSPDGRAVQRLAGWLARQPGAVLTVSRLGQGGPPDALLAEAQGMDLVIAGFRGRWLRALTSFRLEGRPIGGLPCALLAVHGREED